MSNEDDNQRIMRQNIDEIENVPSLADSNEGGLEDEDFGNFDQMFDPIQAFGQLFVAQNDQTNTGETVAEILASMRDIMDKGVKVLYKINLNLEKKK